VTTVAASAALLRRGRQLEAATLTWNIIGIAILAVAALRAHSVALAGFGLDSLIEIGASTVVLWELSGTGQARQRKALRLITGAFLALAAYLTIQTAVVLATAHHPHHSPLGVAWTAATAIAMFALAYGKNHASQALRNPVLTTESRVTVIDGLLACAVLLGLLLNALLDWWWADPAAGSSSSTTHYAKPTQSPATTNHTTGPPQTRSQIKPSRRGPVRRRSAGLGPTAVR